MTLSELARAGGSAAGTGLLVAALVMVRRAAEAVRILAGARAVPGDDAGAPRDTMRP